MPNLIVWIGFSLASVSILLSIIVVNAPIRFVYYSYLITARYYAGLVSPRARRRVLIVI